MEHSYADDATWYVAFDTRTGRVVNLHQFIEPIRDDNADKEAATASAAAREARILQEAKELSNSPTLRVMQVPRQFPIEAGVLYRVEPETGALTKEREAPRTLREFVSRARARKASRDRAGRER